MGLSPHQSTMPKLSTDVKKWKRETLSWKEIETLRIVGGTGEEEEGMEEEVRGRKRKGWRRRR